MKRFRSIQRERLQRELRNGRPKWDSPPRVVRAQDDVVKRLKKEGLTVPEAYECFDLYWAKQISEPSVDEYRNYWMTDKEGN